nr:hypothetical protein C46H11.10 - Caenorhabditis elegans [Caenorhabditis elegans]
MTTDSLSQIDTDQDEYGEEIEMASNSLGNLPDVVLQHLAPFLQWSTCRALSEVNLRFRSHFKQHLKEGQALSIKGQVSVGVGDRVNDCQNVSFLSEFYTIRVEMDDNMVVDWTLKLQSGVRTVVHRHYDGNTQTTTTKSVHLSSRDYLEKVLKWILARYQFKKIHLGVQGLAPLFSSYKGEIENVGISDEIEYLKLAEKFRPKHLTLFKPAQNTYNKGFFDLKKFPQLEELRMYGVPLDLDQLIESNISEVAADTIDKDIKLKHNWKNGIINYKSIMISPSCSQFGIYCPHNQWSELTDHLVEANALYDNVVNIKEKIGSARYSPRSFEFEVWEADRY